ncbi:hypothetical protein AMTR_s00013p00242380 [Amborella trichopoda]|uniref:Uncharacterized protein n=1 Tax=Amborella trichopoda TaxID=13333 RepID=W1PQE5_AMBTC|nr:hypothetical protein AMTR_s00013p00242380 [Amborella trichopoda]
MAKSPPSLVISSKGVQASIDVSPSVSVEARSPEILMDNLEWALVLVPTLSKISLAVSAGADDHRRQVIEDRRVLAEVEVELQELKVPIASEEAPCLAMKQRIIKLEALLEAQKKELHYEEDYITDLEEATTNK